MIRRLLPLGLVALVAACGGAAGTPAEQAAPTTLAAATETVPSTTAAAAGDTAPAVAVPDALQFSAPLVHGGEIELATLAGRPVLLWFWAPW